MAGHRRIAAIVNQCFPSQAPVLKNNCAGEDSLFSDLKFVKTEKKGRVGIIRLNRPNQLNALSDGLMHDIVTAITRFNKDESVGCLILTGEGKAFAAGADIKEMVDSGYHHISTHDHIEVWETISKSKLPLIAAVNGVAFGGGCEIALMCDIIICSEKARFGQPEIKIGTIPGAGGTQRLVRAIGKSKAMEMILTGRALDANEALRYGLVSAVVIHEELLTHALQLANEIASLSRPIVILAKEAVKSSFDSGLSQGINYERRLFHSSFALKDKIEGMRAFIEKRKPLWSHQ